MYQELWIGFTFEFFVLLAAQAQKQRTASLIVLPPLVLGYDELYDENSPGNETSSADIEKLKHKVKQPINSQAKANPAENQKKRINKDAKTSPNVKRTDVKFIRQGHKLNFMGHFLFPHDESDCPFHDSPDPKFELLNIEANRRSQGNLNLRRSLESIVKNNLLKSLGRPQSKTVDDKGNLIVRGNVLRVGSPKVINKGDNKTKEIVTAKNKGVYRGKLEETERDKKAKETATAKNKGVYKPEEIVKTINQRGNKLKEIVLAKTKRVFKPEVIVKAITKGDNKPRKNVIAKNKGVKETVSQGSFGPIASNNITEDLLKELTVGMLSRMLLNQ